MGMSIYDYGWEEHHRQIGIFEAVTSHGLDGMFEWLVKRQK